MPTRELVLEGARQQFWTAALIGAAALAALCLVLLYQYERRLVPPLLGRTLLGLRLAAAGVLLVALFEPQWTSTYSQQAAGRILVAVDVSQSMDTADPSLSDAEVLRLARALGVIGNAATDAQLDEWVAALEQDREPAWVSPDEVADGQQAAVLADSRRATVTALRTELARLPRIEIARRLLLAGPTPLVDRLSAVGAVDRQVFADRSNPLTPGEFGESLVSPPESLTRAATDLSQPLKSRHDDAPLTAIIVLTDGRDTAGSDSASLAALAETAGAPVFPVLIGSQQRPRDLAVSAIDAPPSVLQKDRPSVRIGLRTTGYAGVPIEVAVAAVGDPAAAIATQTVVPDGDSAEMRVELPAEPLGRHRYTVSVQTQPGETRTDNNSRHFTIQVVDDRVRVLLLDGDARWEFRYLVTALQRDQRVDVTPVLFRQPYLGLLPDTFFERRFELPVDETADNPFNQYDAILVGDVAPQQLGPAVWDRLAEYVRDSAGTLVLMAGKQHMPHDYQSEEFLELLPVQQLELIESNAADAVRPPAERGFRLQLTPDGEAAGALMLDANPVKSRRLWNELPGHTWGLRGQARPGSTVWATAVRADESPDLAAERASAIIVEQHAGAGRVLWIGIDSTWRWRSRTGDLYHHRFWGQLVRSAAEFKVAARTSIVQFGPQRPQIQAEETAVFRAQWTESFLRQHPELVARVELTPVNPGGDQGVVTASMGPAEGRPQEFEARFSELGPGEYRARLILENAEAVVDDVAADLTVVQSASPELANVTADPTLLERMARASGGQLLLPDQLHELPDLLHGEDVSEQRRETIPLWNHWSLLALFCGLVGTEWVLRKLNGLP